MATVKVAKVKVKPQVSASRELPEIYRLTNETLKQKPFRLVITADKSEVFQYEPVTLRHNLTGAQRNYWEFKLPNGQTTFGGLAGQQIERFFVGVGGHSALALAGDVKQSGLAEAPGIVTVKNAVFDGIGGRQPDLWFDASIYTPGTTTNNLGFLTGQSAGVNNAPVFQVNGFNHVQNVSTAYPSPNVFINNNTDFAYALKVVLLSGSQRHIAGLLFNFESNGNGIYNQVIKEVYTHNFTVNVNEDYVLYAYRINGVLNAYINGVQVISNEPNSQDYEMRVGYQSRDFAIAELIHYNQTLTQAESDGLRDYMLQKYSVGSYAS